MNYNVPDYIAREPLPSEVMPPSPRRPTTGFLNPRLLIGHRTTSNWGDVCPPRVAGVGGSRDPIAIFGKKGARLVTAEVKKLPRELRPMAMKAILESIDDGLYAKVATKIVENGRSRGLSPDAALERALASSFANHYVEQLVAIGKRQQSPRQGLVGLGCADGQAVAQARFDGWLNAPEPLEGFWSGLKKIGKTTLSVVTAPARYTVKGAKYAGKGVVKAAKAVGSAGYKALKGLGKLTCALANSGAVDQAAGAAASAGPLGLAAGGAASLGAQLAKGACNSSPPAPPPPTFAERTKSNLPLILLGVGGVAAIYLVTRSR